MALSILSRDELRKAVVSEDADGMPVITYYRSTEGQNGSGWRFDRECSPKVPFHEALNVAYRILNGPPRIGRDAR